MIAPLRWELGACHRTAPHIFGVGRSALGVGRRLLAKGISSMSMSFPWHAVVPPIQIEGAVHPLGAVSSYLPLWSYYDYNMVMELVSVAQLKSKLSHYLAAVKRGKEITVTSHRHSIARIVPLDNSGADLKIIPARKPVSSLRKVKAVKLKADLVADLLADRRRR